MNSGVYPDLLNQTGCWQIYCTAGVLLQHTSFPSLLAGRCKALDVLLFRYRPGGDDLKNMDLYDRDPGDIFFT